VQSLEACLREDLNQNAMRRLAVLKPLKVVIENYPEGQTEEFDALNKPNDESAGTRKVPFGREFYIEQDDFMEDPPKKFFRLGPGREVRLRYAYFVTCTDFIKNDAGEVIELRCTYDPETKGGNAPDGRKVKGTIHWVSADHAVDAEIRQYDYLFSEEVPGSNGDFLDDIKADSLTVLADCKLEPSLAEAKMGETIQFERLGYFCLDVEASSDSLVFNQTIGLRDTWAKKKS
jgi:glutaminyl-tRNA synthetase